MTSLSARPTPAFSEGVLSGSRAGQDNLEQAVAGALANLKPGRSGAAAAYKEVQRLVLENAVLTELSPQVSPKAAAAVVEHLRSNLIDEALKKSTRAHKEALGKAGIPSSVLDLLQSWVEVTVDARVVQRQIELKRAVESAQVQLVPQVSAVSQADPVQPLSASELGQALGGLSDETVRQRERSGELFSILRPGRKRGREYPAFQGWAGVAGSPLTDVLAALGPATSTAAYGFFTGPTDLLGGLTPIEALIGRLTTQRHLDAETQDLLVASSDERLQAVIKAAEAYAATLAA